MGSGLGVSSGRASALQVFEGDLIVGGDFSRAGGMAVSSLARWNGSEWAWMPGLGTVQAMTVWRGGLIIGGSFDSGFHRLARLSGTWFEPVGGGVVGQAVYALHVGLNDELVVGGTFSAAGSIGANNIAAWDGSAWRPFSGGVEGFAVATYALTQFHGELVVGGSFAQAGIEPVAGLARWTDDGAPWVAVQPSDATAACDETVMFSVEPASGYESLAYRWRRNGVELFDGPTGTGSTLAGAGTNVLTITHVSSADSESEAATGYSCEVSNACAGAVSRRAVLVVRNRADFDGDGFVTGVDFDLFVAAFEAGDLGADFDQDGFVTGIDFDLYVAAYEAGC